MKILRLTTRVILFSFLFISTAQAATFTVNSATAGADATPGDGVCATSGSVCTLEAAINEANALAGSDSITMPSSFSQTFNAACVSCTSENALPNITTTIIINGSGSEIDLNSSDLRAFEVSGNLTLGGFYIHGADTTSMGGAIKSTGTVTINNSVISNNTACGAGVTDYGGAIHTTGTLTISSSSIANNICTNGAYAGAIYGSNTSTITISKSSIYGNMVLGAGSHGGGIAATGDLSISNSTIDSNSALNEGGGIYFSGTGTATVTYSTIYDNEATGGDGGGIYAGGATFNLNSSLVSSNTAGGAGPDCSDPITLTSDGYNYFTSATGCTGIVGGDDIGGSDGIDSGPFSVTYGRQYYVAEYIATISDDGNPAFCSGTDMLGQTRGTLCDKGAVEQGVCGDSIVHTARNAAGITEQCDDGNTTSGDGCSSTCQTEGGGGGGAYIATINTDACETAHVSDSNVSLGEVILLLNGTLTYGTLTTGEQALMESTTGTTTIECAGDGCSPQIDCALPTLSNTAAVIFGDEETPFTITASELGNTGRIFEVAGNSVSIKHMTIVGDNDSTAIIVTGNSFTLEDVIITGFDTGLKLQTVTTATIGSDTYPNYFNANGLGVLAQTSTSLTFDSNVFGLIDGILVDGNTYGLAIVDVTNSTFTENTIGASSQIGLLVSGAANLTFNSNLIGTNVNGSRPLGLDWQTAVGANFEILTTSPDVNLIPLPVATAISNINLGDATNSSLNNLFCYNEENMVASGSDVNLNIGLNDFCSGSSGYYSIREGANAGSFEGSLEAPTISEVSATLISGTNYTIEVTGQAQAGTDIRLYKQEVDENESVSASTYLCMIDTDSVGNFSDNCDSEMYATTTHVRILAQICAESCSVVSEFSAISDTSTISLSEESDTPAGSGYLNSNSGGGCSLTYPSRQKDNSVWNLIFFIMIPSLYCYLNRRHSC